ncbi:MAG: hypothetical protein DMF49_09830 [Acidobacteria bacterium]|nr:MAG: hypothetical protein DMF49_09830 [Acidobacteriota bacterium]
MTDRPVFDAARNLLYREHDPDCECGPCISDKRLLGTVDEEFHALRVRIAQLEEYCSAYERHLDYAGKNPWDILRKAGVKLPEPPE